MRYFGLHILDLVIIFAALLAVIVLGLWVSRDVQGETEFYVGKRSIGKWLQFFMNFGTMSDPNAASMVASAVFAEGAGGMWVSGFQLLFATPIYWFSSIWFRRTRVITMSDLFMDRYNSKTLATAYAAISVISAIGGIAFGNLISYKVVSAMIVKSPSAYTAAERQSVREYQDYIRLKPQGTAGTLKKSDTIYYALLDSEVKKGNLKSSISYIKPIPFYLVYNAVVLVYVVLGGLRAAAITDAFQGTLILLFSVMLIPLGLAHVGGFAGLHRIVPDAKFALFGTEAAGDFTWYSTLAIVVNSIISVMGGGSVAAAAAKDEKAIRFGMVGGAFAKRAVTVSWMLCGILALAIFPQGLADPDAAWGAISRVLLPTGLLGLMIAATLLGHMPSVGLNALNISALFTRNVYEVFLPDRSDRHYLFVARITILVVTLLGILLATAFTGFLALISVIITFGAFLGAMALLVYFWRRLTAEAILVGMAAALLMVGILPLSLSQVKAIRQDPNLLLQSQSHTIMVQTAATQADVDAHRASAIGQTLIVPDVLPPTALFFESVARINPNDPKSRLEGIGRFNLETFLLYHMDLPLTKYRPAQLVTARWIFDTVAPFVIMIFFSYVLPPIPIPGLTRAQQKAEQDIRNARFFAKMKTPVAPTPEQDAEELAKSFADPTRFERQNLFPNTNWKFGRWGRADALGFLACWGVVAGILGLLWLVLNVGS